MKRPTFPTAPIVHPTLLAVLCYAVLIRLASIFAFTTVRHGTPGEAEWSRGPAWSLAALLTAIHVAFALLLVRMLRPDEATPVGLRRAHAVGALVGLCVLAGLQWSVFTGMDAFDALNSGGR